VIKEQSGLGEPFDGILGMARNNPFWLDENSQSDHVIGPLLVTQLYEQNLISENTFSFYFGDLGDQSFCDFGKPSKSAMSDPDDIRELRMENDFFWSAYN
jgi:hypothetical protein